MAESSWSIQTFYRGYHFRSRLEAKWAVFFDAIGVRYVYELDGFQLFEGKIRYLPDFYFPDSKLYGEVKGADYVGEIPEKDLEKMSWMIDYNGPCANGIVLLGNIPDPYMALDMVWAVWHHDIKCIRYEYYLGHAPNCDNRNLHFLDNADESVCESAPSTLSEQGNFPLTYAINLFAGDHLVDTAVHDALCAARSARFEFGEEGSTWQ